MNAISLLFTPALLIAIGLAVASAPHGWFPGRLVLVPVILILGLVLASLAAAVIDLIQIARAATWSAQVPRLAVHGIGLSVSSAVIWQAVHFLIHGLERLW